MRGARVRFVSTIFEQHGDPKVRTVARVEHASFQLVDCKPKGFAIFALRRQGEAIEISHRCSLCVFAAARKHTSIAPRFDCHSDVARSRSFQLSGFPACVNRAPACQRSAHCLTNKLPKRDRCLTVIVTAPVAMGGDHGRILSGSARRELIDAVRARCRSSEPMAKQRADGEAAHSAGVREFAALTGYHRKSATRVLNGDAGREVLSPATAVHAYTTMHSVGHWWCCGKPPIASAVNARAAALAGPGARASWPLGARTHSA